METEPYGTGTGYSKWLTNPVANSARTCSLMGSSTRNSCNLWICFGVRNKADSFHASNKAGLGRIRVIFRNLFIYVFMLLAEYSNWLTRLRYSTDTGIFGNCDI